MAHVTRWLVANVACIAVLWSVPAGAQRQRVWRLPETADAFAAAEPFQKVGVLTALASLRISIPAPELEHLLDLALHNDRADVRATALSVVAGRSGGVRVTPSPERLALWPVERPHLQQLRAAVVQLLGDADQKVRVQAFLALGNLDYELGGPVEVVLSEEAQRLFATRFAVEPSRRLRADIVKAFASTPAHSPLIAEVLRSALLDPAGVVVAEALRGMGTLRPPNTVGQVAALLAHAEAAVRERAALALARYEAAGKTHLPELRTALAMESDPTVIEALEGTIRALE
jgi:HEAT repeat protein